MRDLFVVCFYQETYTLTPRNERNERNGSGKDGGTELEPIGVSFLINGLLGLLKIRACGESGERKGGAFDESLEYHLH